MHINSGDGINRLKADGYKLANAVKNFDLPKGPWHLINEDYLKVYVEYEATTQDGAATRTGVSRLRRRFVCPGRGGPLEEPASTTWRWWSTWGRFRGS